jgi:hypothetical protein
MRYVVHETLTGRIVKSGEAGTLREAQLQRGLSLTERSVSVVPQDYSGHVSDVSMSVVDGLLVQGDRVVCQLAPADELSED